MVLDEMQGKIIRRLTNMGKSISPVVVGRGGKEWNKACGRKEYLGLHYGENITLLKKINNISGLRFQTWIEGEEGREGR